MKLFAVALLSLGLSTSAARAEPAAPTASTIIVTNAWLRATPKGAPVAGGYVTITNTGATPDRLVSASLAIAPKGEVHTMAMANGVMHMARLDGGLTVAPNATVTLQPGGEHLMFPNPTAPIKEGATVSGALTFEKAGSIPVTFTVAGMAAKSAPGAKSHHDMMHMDGMDMKDMDVKGH